MEIECGPNVGFEVKARPGRHLPSEGLNVNLSARYGIADADSYD
jgi:hypothetical protein